MFSLLHMLSLCTFYSGYDVISKNPHVDIYRCTAFRLELLSPGVVMVDGEAFLNLKAIQGEVIKGVARVFTG